MRLFDRLKTFYQQYIAWINLHWLVVIVFLVLTFVLSDSNLWVRLEYDRKISELENKIQSYKEKIAVDKKKLDDVHEYEEGLERFAREEYLMKRENEDIFIIEE